LIELTLAKAKAIPKDWVLVNGCVRLRNDFLLV
jgi:hypothetical protein